MGHRNPEERLQRVHTSNLFKPTEKRLNRLKKKTQLKKKVVWTSPGSS